MEDQEVQSEISEDKLHLMVVPLPGDGVTVAAVAATGVAQVLLARPAPALMAMAVGVPPMVALPVMVTLLPPTHGGSRIR